jgi:hypothetical protein
VKHKSEQKDALEAFYKEHIHNRRDLVDHELLVVLQCDQDAVTRGSHVKRWLSDNKIVLQMSTAFKQSQNGQIERDMQNVLDRARTFLASYDVPQSWWWHAVKEAIWFINRSPTSKNDNKTPLELMYNKKPDMKEMIPFFCPGLYNVTKSEREPDAVWKWKARCCRFIGHDLNSKTYTVWDIESQKIVEGRSDIVWDPTLLDKYVQTSNDMLKAFQRARKLAKRMQSDNESINNKKSSDLKINKDAMRNTQINKDTDSDDDEPRYWSFEHEDVLQNAYNNYELYTEVESEADPNSMLHKLNVMRELDNEERMYFAYDNNAEDQLDLLIHHIILSATTELKLPPVPKNEAEALDPNRIDRDEWYQAILNEMEQFDKYKIFKAAPQVGHAMKTKFVFTLTYRSDYTLKYKARLVVCGYSQIKGIDYTETFAPTIGTNTVFILLFLAGWGDFQVSVFDVTAAFLEGEADCVQYCRLPLCISRNNVQQRVQIIGNMYGEKQAPKVWNDKLHKILTEIGLERCPWDACLYMGWFENKFIMISIHVDDGYVVSTDMETIKLFHSTLLKYIRNATLFEPKESVQKYIGIDIKAVRTVDVNGDVCKKMYLSQKDYIRKMDLFPETGKTQKIPMASNINLRGEDPNPDLDSLLPVTGKLRYVCDRTRPDVLVATGEISTGSQPSDLHYKVAKQIVKYLKDTVERELVLGGSGDMKHFAFSDAAYISAGKSKSRLGHCQFLGTDSGAINCTSVNDNTVSHSSMEAEIKALDLLILSIIHTRNILDFLGYTITVPTIIFCDNKSAIELCKTLKMTQKSKHIQMRINFIRECINNRIVEIVFVPSQYNVADVLTKPLADVLFNEHANKLLYGFNGDLLYILSNNITYEQVNISIEKRMNN